MRCSRLREPVVQTTFTGPVLRTCGYFSPAQSGNSVARSGCACAAAGSASATSMATTRARLTGRTVPGGMEHVWSYPRPPALVPCERRVRIELGGRVIADSARALRVLETSHPPAIYVPATDFAPGVLQDAPGSSWCEWKGRASYLDLVAGDVAARAAAWTYRDPVAAYAALRDHVAVYPSRV